MELLETRALFRRAPYTLGHRYPTERRMDQHRLQSSGRLSWALVSASVFFRQRCRRLRNPRALKIEESLVADPWRRGFEAAPETHPVMLEAIEGEIPSDLVGTIYRNSAGRLRIGASEYEHWFDGDGFVSALSVDGVQQKAAFASRFVRTPLFVAQEKPGAFARAQEGLGMASVGAWTPADHGDFFSNVFRLATNPANTSVLWWGDRLLALCEGGLPYRLDPGTLETLGEDLFKDRSISESGVSFFSAHPKRDPTTGELFNIGLTISVPQAIEVYCCSATGELLQRAKVPLKEFTFVHDFAITEKYIVLIMPPWVCPVDGLLQSLWEGGLGRKFGWQEELGTRCVLLKRSDLSTVFDETLMPPVSLYHTVNAFEEDDTVKLQIAAHIGPREHVEKHFRDMYRSNWTDETRCSLKEVTLDISLGRISIRSVGPSDAASFELPTIHPAFIGRTHRHVFTNSAYPSTAGFANTVERLDLQKNLVDRAVFEEGQFTGEPMVIPKESAKDELSAYVCTCVYDANSNKSFFAFFDAAHLSAGPVAKVHLPTHLPYSFHGEWVQGKVDVLHVAQKGGRVAE